MSMVSDEHTHACSLNFLILILSVILIVILSVILIDQDPYCAPVCSSKLERFRETKKESFRQLLT